MQKSIICVLVDFPAFRNPRRELREKVGEAFNSISPLLGGPGEGGRVKLDNASRAKTVETVLGFAEAS